MNYVNSKDYEKEKDFFSFIESLRLVEVNKLRFVIYTFESRRWNEVGVYVNPTLQGNRLIDLKVITS